MRRQSNSDSLAAYLLILTAFIGIPAAASAAESERGDWFVSASIAEASTLVPIVASDSASHDIVSRIFNGLLRYNPKLELEGDLAERWEILDGGKTIVFYLRRNVLWHDLAPFTAEDVKFTYDKLIDPATPTPYGGDFVKVRSLEIVDLFTVRVSYEAPFAPALGSWTMPIMPKHLLEGQDLAKTPFARSPIGTGPYKFKRWIDADRIELTAFDRYYEGRPLVEGIVARVIPDQTTAFLELHQETVDSMGLAPLQYLRLTDNAFFKSRYRKFRYPSLGYTYLGFNLQNDLFKDRLVRKAINLAIDKKEIIQGVLLGLGRESTGPFTPESWAYNPAVKSAPFSPIIARKLLERAGWKDSDGDGTLDRDGKAFEFTISTNPNFQRQLAAEIIQRRLADVGIRVRLKVIEWSSFLKEFIDKRRFDAVLLAWGLSLEPDPYDIWHSSKTKEGEFNFVSYNNPKVDALIEEGRSTFDREARRKAYYEIHRILYEDQPVVFLFVPESLPIVHGRFRNVEATPIGIGYNFIRWEVPAAERKYTRMEA